jgi:uncharacterized protein (UPF0128 family)
MFNMPDERAEPGEDAKRITEATAFLELHGIPAGAREFRLRQEFFRHGWDVRVRDQGGSWTVHAVKSGRPDVAVQGTTEGNALRVALTAAIGSDEAETSS